MQGPIETEYKGYRFRSRLEARWAVFFDMMGIYYVYEPEGFELEDGTKYLPDFYFPDQDTYGEVKPDRPGARLLHRRCARPGARLPGSARHSPLRRRPVRRSRPLPRPGQPLRNGSGGDRRSPGRIRLQRRASTSIPARRRS